MTSIRMAATPGGAMTLHLMGDFGTDITPRGVAEALKGAAGKPLTVSLNSYGGDALAGIAIHNMLARHDGPVTVVVEGIAASAASLVAMAGARIVMPSNAFMMIHEAWGLAMGPAADLRGQADTLDLVSAAYRRTYAARSGQTEDEVARLMAEETWFNAEGAIALGFATEAADPVEIRASAEQLAHFHRVPAALLAAASTIPAPAIPVPATPPAPPASKEFPMEPTSPAAPDAVPSIKPVAAGIAELRDLATRTGLGADWALARLEESVTLDRAREIAIDAMAAARPAVRPAEPARVIRDERDTFLAQASTALAARMTGKQIAHSAEGHDYRDLTLLGLAREVLVRAGVPAVHRLNNDQVYERIMAQTHTASDFPNLLVNSTNKSVAMLFAAQNNNWSSWCDETEYDDFKTITATNVGQFPEPLAMSEGGPVTLGTIGEEAETFAIAERGRLLRLSRPMIINDDLRGFTMIVNAAANGAYTALRRGVFTTLTANAAMADTIALFNAAHNNLGTAGAMTATTYGELWTLLAQQVSPSRTGLDPSTPPLPPPNALALIVAPNKMRTALELTSALIVPTAVGNALPAAWRSQVEVVTDGFLNTGNGPYYLARTEPGMRAIEIAYLRGRRTPTVENFAQADFTGITFRLVFDFGVKATTWRTIAANLG